MTQVVWRPEWPQMGDEVQDVVNKKKGIVTGYTGFLWGCQQVCVSRLDKDEKDDSCWLDIARVKVIKRDKIEAVDHTPEDPKPEPSKRKPNGAETPAATR